MDTEKEHVKSTINRPAWARGLEPGSGDAEYRRRVEDYRRVMAGATYCAANTKYYSPLTHEQLTLATFFERALAGSYVGTRKSPEN